MNPGAVPQEKTRRGRPANPAKRQAILETARRLFLERGYGIGLEGIAAEAGVSRQTIYNLFASKDELFAAIVQETSATITAPLADLKPGSLPRQVLTLLGQSYLRILSSERSVSLQRLLIHAAPQFPSIGPTFYANGPGRGIGLLADYLRRETSSGRLAVEDAELAAEQFFGMLVGKTSLRRLLRLQDGPLADAEITRRVESAVAAFLRAYSATA
ncbi:TetR/AcrR family transcriptional regulator [Ferrovibrio sp.]|uniref:TetR/AcrR family transcriptional regulator n=1 Tax=Ferrovibrio sp. TaxID=1917215 RepID=UPI001B5B5CE1|nr:TetR/AcrR family transcriptional regulator [Ferrovibrio sp.]MBP7066451.1 TetR/AcrR family transcriptional regulator [Ferrovibrio sp.]